MTTLPDASNLNHVKITYIKSESNLMILDIIFIRLKNKSSKTEGDISVQSQPVVL